MIIFHIALRDDWDAAVARGVYTTSSVGRTLEEEGFIHASRRDQVAGVYDRYYRAIAAPLVVLTVDTDLLDVPWREDPVGDDTYPHIYGPLSPSAVVAVEPMEGPPRV